MRSKCLIIRSNDEVYGLGVNYKQRKIEIHKEKVKVTKKGDLYESH